MLRSGALSASRQPPRTGIYDGCHQQLLIFLYRDKAGRSVPAPGRGALSVARQIPSKHPLPILDLSYRSRQLAFRRNQISQWLDNEHVQLKEEIAFRKSEGEPIGQDYLAARVADIEMEAVLQEKEAQATYGMLEGSDPRIAPLRRALAVWGLTADDIGVLSIHGTSTGANVRLTSHPCIIPHAHPCVGEERDQDLERYIHHHRSYQGQRRAYYGAEESRRTRKGRFRCLAVSRPAPDGHHGCHSGQPQQRVRVIYAYR